MKLATTTVDFGKFPLTDIEKVQALYDAGFRYIDLSMYNGTTINWPYSEPDWEDKVDRLKQYADNLGITFVQAHSPAGNPLIFNEDYDRLVTRTIRSIEVCSKLGIKILSSTPDHGRIFCITPKMKSVISKKTCHFCKHCSPQWKSTMSMS